MPTAERVDDEIVVKTHWNEAELIKMVPGARWNNEEKHWTLPLSWAACLQLRGIFTNTLVLGPELKMWARDERTFRVDVALRLREVVEPSDVHAHIDDRLYGFQKAGVDFLLRAGSALLGDEMGTGKTVQTLETLRQLDLKDRALPALIICPNSMKGTWAKEAATWFPDATPYVIAGTAVKRKKLFTAAMNDDTALVIINFESVRMHSRIAGFGSIALKGCKSCKSSGYVGVKEAQCEMHERELNKIPFQTIVIDEAHRVKDPNAKQTRAIWATGQGSDVKHRYALTGTPIANSPEDIWSIMHFVAPDEYPYKSKFVDRYCLNAWNAWGGLDVIGINPAHKEEFFKILDPRFRRTPKALVLKQLPPKMRSRRVVQMTDKQAKAYKEIEKTLTTRLEDGSLMILKSDLTANLRLIQFSSAYMEQGPDKQVKVVDKWSGETRYEMRPTWKMTDVSPKLDAMEEILDEMAGRQIAICAEHAQLINLAEQRLQKAGITYGKITGEVQQWERDIMLAQFQKGELQVMLFTIKAGGVGLTMTAADTILFLQRSWSMVENKQAEDRVHRIGSEKHEVIHIIDLVAEDTVEVDQIDDLWAKAERLEEITRDRSRLAAEGVSTEALDHEELALLNTAHAKIG